MDLTRHYTGYGAGTLKQAMINAGQTPTPDNIQSSLFSCSNTSRGITFNKLCPKGCYQVLFGNDYCN